MFWGTVYSLSIGVNYGAFSWTFYASLTGIMWREALGRQHVRVGGLEFMRVMLPIVVAAMVVACSVLVGQVYIAREETAYDVE